MIDEYNNGAINVQIFFDKLMVFAKRLDAEEKRGIAEQLTEEELVIFDLLTKPKWSSRIRRAAEVKKVAKTLLEKLKQEKLVLDWRKQQTTRAMVLVTIKDILNELPRAIRQDPYEQKCDTVYQHFYEAYYGSGQELVCGELRRISTVTSCVNRRPRALARQLSRRCGAGPQACYENAGSRTAHAKELRDELPF